MVDGRKLSNIWSSWKAGRWSIVSYFSLFIWFWKVLIISITHRPDSLNCELHLALPGLEDNDILRLSSREAAVGLLPMSTVAEATGTQSVRSFSVHDKQRTHSRYHLSAICLLQLPWQLKSTCLEDTYGRGRMLLKLVADNCVTHSGETEPGRRSHLPKTIKKIGNEVGISPRSLTAPIHLESRKFNCT